MELIVRPESKERAALRAALAAHGLRAAEASDLASARALFERDDVDVAILSPALVDALAEHSTGERIRAALEAAQVGLWDWDLRTNSAFFSREWKQQLGYAEHEIGDQFVEWESRVHPDDLDRAYQAIREYLDEPTRGFEVELRMQHKDGSYRWILARCALERDGEVQRLRGSHVDVTERKLAQLALAEREAQLAVFIEHAPVPIAMFDHDMRYLAASRSWMAAYRLEGQEVIGRSYYDVFPGIPDTWRALHQRALAGEVLGSDAQPYHRADGKLDWIRWETRPWPRHDGSVGGIVTFSEIITERRETEDALRRSEAHLRHLTDAIPHMIWELWPNGELGWANQALREYYGRDEFTQDAWITLVHPDDAPELAGFVDRTLEAVGRGDLGTLRLRGRDGNYRWFSNHALVVRDDAGEPLYTIGTSTDVHELKQTRDALAASQQRLVTALQAAGMGTWRWDLDTDHFTVDPSLAGLLGYAPARFEGLTLAQALVLLVAPDELGATEALFRRGVEQGDGLGFE